MFCRNTSLLTYNQLKVYSQCPGYVVKYSTGEPNIVSCIISTELFFLRLSFFLCFKKPRNQQIKCIRSPALIGAAAGAIPMQARYEPTDYIDLLSMPAQRSSARQA